MTDIEPTGSWPSKPHFAVHVGRGKCVQCRRYIEHAPAIVFHLARTSVMTRHYVLCLACLDRLRDTAMDWHEDAVPVEPFGLKRS